MKHTIQQLANNFSLWAEFIDPDAAYSLEEFEAMTEDRRISLVIAVVEANA